VVQQNGVIRIIKNGATLATPFLDISALTSDGYERGLLGMAFRPDFANSRRFYVCYTRDDGDVVVARYRATNNNPDVSMANADSVVLRIEHSTYENHNGGMLAFGPDGMLYMSVGDGGGVGDPNHSGQDPTDLLGSILRLNVNGNGATVPVRQSARKRGVELGASQPVALQLRPGDRRSLHRRRRRGRVGGSGRRHYDLRSGPGRELWLAGPGRHALLRTGDLHLGGTHAAGARVWSRFRRILHHRRLRVPRAVGAGPPGALLLR
jgi:hypothetical protein